MAERRRLSVDERRARLLDAAEHEFGRRSPTEVSVADVARVAGVSPPLVHHYFGGLRGLYGAMLERILDGLVDATVVRFDESGPARLRRGLAAHVRFAAEHPDGYRFVAAGAGGDAEVAELCERARWRSLQSVLAALGIDHPSPALRIALRGWQGYVEAAVTEWLGRRDLEERELVELLAAPLEPIVAGALSSTAS